AASIVSRLSASLTSTLLMPEIGQAPKPMADTLRLLLPSGRYSIGRSLLRLESRLQHVPLVGRDRFESVEFTRPAEPLAAVDRHHVAGDVRRIVGEQIGRQVRQFLVLTIARERYPVCRIERLGQLRRHQPRPGPFGRKRTRSDRVQANAVLAPL